VTTFSFWVICAVVAGLIGDSRGRNGFAWFLLGCVIGIFAVILVALLPSKKATSVIGEAEVQKTEEQVRCPR